MKTAKEVEAKFEMISGEVQESEASRMNAMIDPQFHGCDTDTMTVEVRYEAKDWEKNHRDELHGGVVAAMFDTAMGISLLALSDHDSVATSDLDVSFIRPFSGASFIFEVNIIRIGRTLARVRALAKDEATDKLLASATANFVYKD